MYSGKPIKSGLILCLIFLVTSIAMTSCHKEKVYKIGVSQCSDDDWRSKMNDEIERETMFHENVQVEILSADDSNEKQIADLKRFVEEGVDAIIVSPNEAEALTPTISEIYSSGIPVIIFDRNILGDTYTARIGVDDEGIGRSAASYALNLFGKRQREGRGPKAIEIYGLAGSTPAIDRHHGFSGEFIRGGGEIVASVPANWNEEDAVIVADSLLKIYTDVDLVFAHNDRMAIGASKVARKLGLDGIKVIGIDAAPTIGLEAVADSVIDATFLYPTEGYRMVRTALAILNGEPYEKNTLIPASSAVDNSNADVLLLQNEAIREETQKMRELKRQIDDYWAQHSSQTSLFYACIVIIILLFILAFLLLRAYWQHTRHQKTLMEQNQLLQEERDKQKELNQKLRDATQSKLMFFTNVSHDLRTPLTLISEPVAQLLEAPNLTPGQRMLTKIADKNIRILQRLINQILDFRKYENGKLSVKLSEVNIGQAIENWLEAFYAVARKRDIKLRLVKSREEIACGIDTEKIERVFFNLVSNAFKYTPDNGSITVEYHKEENNLILSVEDTGEGISERDLGSIFDRFFQVDKVRPKGSGIGLSLAKAFAELHGGNINVESVLGKGSKFTVILPIKHVAEQTVPVENNITESTVQSELAPVEPVIGDNDGDKPLILVIDDNNDIRKMVSALLADEYAVITAPNGKEGIRMAAKYTPDLVVCDVMMPVMDGLECCRRIKEEVSTSHIPVMMLTACGLDEQRVEGYESGADGYVSKPFSSAVIKARIKNLIANRKRIKELWTGTTANPVGQDEPSGQRKQEGDKPTVPPSESAPKPTLPRGDIDNSFYNSFLEIFEKEMGNSELNIEQIASRLGLGHSQFYRKIKALTNYTPVELMRQLRLKRARQLLTTTDKTVSEIAYEVGFSTPAYFTKCYRTAFGETPTELREKLGQA